MKEQLVWEKKKKRVNFWGDILKNPMHQVIESVFPLNFPF